MNNSHEYFRQVVSNNLRNLIPKIAKYSDVEIFNIFENWFTCSIDDNEHEEFFEILVQEYGVR